MVAPCHAFTRFDVCQGGFFINRNEKRGTATWSRTTIHRANSIKSFYMSCGVVLSVCGYCIAASYNACATNIANLNKEMLAVKIELTKINAEMLTEDRVKDIVETELLKHGIK